MHDHANPNNYTFLYLIIFFVVRDLVFLRNKRTNSDLERNHYGEGLLQTNVERSWSGNLVTHNNNKDVEIMKGGRMTTVSRKKLQISSMRCTTRYLLYYKTSVDHPRKLPGYDYGSCESE
ncbi:hypothetical protein F8388_013875 [Cannabis sativa]|uniref:Uncharacterized protein n=1 Tax=Cannabis sativa TaxID=3483 RepID=A0A7J6E983_CANSA|nr:hypothetical protein F8388_013875 [Cannabis sativa]